MTETIAQFYAPRYWGLGWHKKYKLGRETFVSQGLDLEHGTHTSIPALHGGTVVLVAETAALGKIVTIKHEAGYDTYIHVTSRAKLHSTVHAGHQVAIVAGSGDPHGTAWSGPHLSLHTGKTLASAYGVGTTNPATSIRKVL